MATAQRKKKVSSEERDRLQRLSRHYANRITTAKQGKESLDAGDYGNTIKKFLDYLVTVAEVKELNNFYELKVSHFDPKKDVMEMLMMSHIFFELARIYDAIPKFQEDSQKCLSQFVHFTANQPYQVLNSEMMRKHLKRTAFKKPEIFNEAYRQIFIQSKQCYIVTYCYGNEHPITLHCRLFKDFLLGFPMGESLVRFYYLISSKSVKNYQHQFLFKLSARFVARPLLLLFSKTILPLIIKR